MRAACLAEEPPEALYYPVKLLPLYDVGKNEEKSRKWSRGCALRDPKENGPRRVKETHIQDAVRKVYKYLP